MTRRELIWRAAQAGGYSAALVLMRSMDLVADPAQRATHSIPHPIQRRSGHESRHHRRRNRRPCRGVRDATIRIRLHRSRGTTAAWRTQLDDPSRREDRVRGRLGANMHVRRGAIFQRGCGAHSRHTRDDSRLLPGTRRADGGAGQHLAWHVVQTIMHLAAARSSCAKR